MFLPDSVLGEYRSAVYVQVTQAGRAVEDAKRLLANPGGDDVQLQRVVRDAKTVIYEVVKMPWIRVGRSPYVDEESDVADIKRVLGEGCHLLD